MLRSHARIRNICNQKYRFWRIKKTIDSVLHSQNAFHRRLELIIDQEEYIDFEEGAFFVAKKLNVW